MSPDRAADASANTPDRAADPAPLTPGGKPIARRIDLIVLHCSATDNPSIRAADIDRWHKNRGFARIGYHFFIGSDGLLEPGRELEAVGAHAKGFNNHSIGICLNGLGKFNTVQFDSLRALLARLKPLVPGARIVGHRELDPHKACPVYDTAPHKAYWLSL